MKYEFISNKNKLLSRNSFRRSNNSNFSLEIHQKI
jgi:hypothetical protein